MAADQTTHLWQLDEKFKDASLYTEIVLICVTMLVWLVVFAILVWRRQLLRLATAIKVSLLLYPVQLGLTLLNCLEPTSPFWFSLPIALFMSNHWIFAWHYLKAACMFRPSFSSHSIDQLA